MSKSEDTDFLDFICDGGNEDQIAGVMQWTKENGGERSFVFEERIGRANSLVDSGNGLFKSGDHKEAQKHYLGAAHQVDFDFGQQFEMTEEHRKQVRSIKIRILLNVCNNLLKLQDYRGVRRSATLGLKLCKSNKKILMEIRKNLSLLFILIAVVVRFAITSDFLLRYREFVKDFDTGFVGEFSTEVFVRFRFLGYIFLTSVFN
jgi:hypothetical protein